MNKIKGWFFRTFFKKQCELLGAINYLCEIHTGEDYDIGFYIKMGATPDPWQDDRLYIEAWTTLRRAAGRSVDRDTL